ncbi:MAG: GNAT family N-acyltransferase [Pseudomonadota bacterium]
MTENALSTTTRPVEARSNALLVRLAEDEAELRAAQRLRYRVFYQERDAQPVGEMAREERDFDDFDPVCDHLLVIDESRSGDEAVVGCYRFMRRAGADALGRFYTSGEYDIQKLLDADLELMELGRSCIAADYRNKASMTLLWRGIGQYVLRYDVGMMFGCASLPGVDTAALAPALSYLHHRHLAPEPFRVRALEDLFTPMDETPIDAVDERRVLAGLPPLIKGYLRLGGYVGDGAVIDHQFNTTDVCVMVKTDQVTDKYYRHYTRDADG